MLWSAANANSNMDTNVLVYSYYLLPTHCSILSNISAAGNRTTCKVNHVLQLLSVLLLKLVNKTEFFKFS